jgi:hypothetical protein
VALLLHRLGFVLGSDLNESLDNLWFTLLFKDTNILRATNAHLSYRLELFMRRMQGQRDFSDRERDFLMTLASEDRPQHNKYWLSRRVNTFLSGPVQSCPEEKWAWKEPNTHIVARHLLCFSSELRYVHVVRHGLDMAFSANQRQLHFWGPSLPEIAELGVTPRSSLKFWCRAQRAALHARARWPDRVFLLNFDQLCCNPETVLSALLAFLGEDAGAEKLGELAGAVAPPPSMGRFRRHDVALFDSEDLEFVASLGFRLD